jgi:pimeloyl-ACP methyl ester carboxylesterase
VYNYYKPENSVTKYVLLAGGDDVGIYYHRLGKAKFWKILNKAKQKIKKRQGKEIMPELLAHNLIFSYKGFYDIANPDGDYNVFPFLEAIKKLKLSKKKLFRHFKAIKKPTLVVYGSEDEYAWGDVPRVVNILEKYQPGLDYKIIKNANHNFENHKPQLAKIIADWL